MIYKFFKPDKLGDKSINADSEYNSALHCYYYSIICYTQCLFLYGRLGVYQLAVTKVHSKIAKRFILVMIYVFKFQNPCTTLEWPMMFSLIFTTNSRS